MASVFSALSDGIHTASPQDIAWVAASSVWSRLRTRPTITVLVCQRRKLWPPLLISRSCLACCRKHRSLNRPKSKCALRPL